MAPVGRELARSGQGILEPFQTSRSLDGQVRELADLLGSDATLPVSLLGFSWGAWLSLIVAARYPRVVRKLILVGAAPFAPEYAPEIQETRLSRLTPAQRVEFQRALHVLAENNGVEADQSLARLEALTRITDHYDPVSPAETCDDGPAPEGRIFQEVWTEAAELRHSGQLLEIGSRVQCPVVAIHGDYDPHPARGVKETLSGVIDDFRFLLLERCGHKPWTERHARAIFFELVRKELECETAPKTGAG
jgi:pimeloyl-ACP methyl ester carboxylesterase